MLHIRVGTILLAVRASSSQAYRSRGIGQIVPFLCSLLCCEEHVDLLDGMFWVWKAVPPDMQCFVWLEARHQTRVLLARPWSVRVPVSIRCGSGSTRTFSSINLLPKGQPTIHPSQSQRTRRLCTFSLRACSMRLDDYDSPREKVVRATTPCQPSTTAVPSPKHD